MSNSIIGIPTTRVSDLYIRERLLNQVQSDLTEMSKIQMQLSTGRRFEAPSEDPVAAMRVVGLQSLIQRKDQIKSNLNTNSSFLGATDSALSDVASLLSSARATALGVVGTTATDQQRNAAAQQIDQLIQHMVDIGNQQFRGRYLFAGTDTASQPFSFTSQGMVQYSGNEGNIYSYADISQLFQTNMQGNEVFGAISTPVAGTVNLTPSLTANTRLADLRQGAGISLGSVVISDGIANPPTVVDLSKAETLADVAATLEANAPAGNTLTVQITSTGLTLTLGSGSLSVREVGGGTTATELGIRRDVANPSPIVGTPLKPILRGTTALANVLGGGLDLDGLQIVNGGQTYNISLAGAATIEDVLNAINGSGAGVLAEINQARNGLNIRSRVSGGDFSIGENGGQTATQLGLRTLTDTTPLAELNFGRGVDNQPGTDFTITFSDDTQVDIDLDGVTDIAGVRTAINNACGAKLQADLAGTGNGIRLVGAAGLSFTVTCSPASSAAVDLGLVDYGQAAKSSTLDPATGRQVVAGADARPYETDGVFTALLRLKGALEMTGSLAMQEKSLAETQRAINLLDDAVTHMTFARAELAARQQGLDAAVSRNESEQIDLKKVLSDEYDADMAQVISDLGGRQVAYEAALKTTAQILQMSLLDYL